MPGTIHSLFERIANSQQEGRCGRCGKVEMLFFGKGYCDDCVNAIWAEREEERRRSSMLDYQAHLIRTGLLSPDTPLMTFETADAPPVENQEVVEKLKLWRMEMNLFLYGPPGVGKSHYGRCLLNRALRTGKTVAEMPVRSLIKLAMRFDQGRGRYQACCRAEVLLVDDIDKGAYNEERLGVIWELLDARCQGKRRTIVTSNLAPVELAEDLVRRVPENSSYGVATLDRLKPVEVHEFRGASQR